MTAVIWACAIGFWDLSRRRIPNFLTFGAGAAALGVLAATGASPLGADARSVLAGVGLGLVLTLPGYFLRQLGAGDVKLLVAVALLGGTAATLASFVLGALAAGAAAAARLVLGPRLGLPPATGRHLPFGACLALGFVVAVIGGQAGWLPAVRPW